MRRSISFVIVFGLLAVGAVGTTADAEAQTNDCVYCDSSSGVCKDSVHGSPDFFNCEQIGSNCIDSGSSCEINPVLRTTVDGMARLASRSEAATQDASLTEETKPTAHARDCAGVILARAYSEQARREIRASTSVITL